MKLDVPYKFLDLKPDDELMNFDWSSITMEDWSKFAKMRQTEWMFAQTYTIPLLGPAINPYDNILPDDIEIVERRTELSIHPLIMREVRKLEQYFNASAKTAALDGLPPGSQILRHFDQGRVPVEYAKAHRCHLPLVTDWPVEFYIDDVGYHFPAGQFFEFDNSRYHEVRNNSNVFRIHLVIDLIPN